MRLYGRYGVRTIINPKGAVTRLSGGLPDPGVSAAMAEAASRLSSGNSSYSGWSPRK